MRALGYLVIVVTATLLVPVGGMAQDTIAWQPTLESARLAAAQSHRLVLIHFVADWCSACKKMDREVFERPGIGSVVEANYVPVKVNADHFPATCRQYGVSVLPTDVIITPDGQLVERLQGAAEASVYISRLNQVAANTRQAPVDHYAQAAKPPMVNSPMANPSMANPQIANSPQMNPRSAPAGVDPAQDYSGFDPVAMGRAATAPYADPYAGQPRATNPMAGPSTEIPHVEVSLPPSAATTPDNKTMAGAGQPSPSVEQPAGNPALGLDGYCPVQLRDDMEANLSKWTMGDRRWGAIHRGRTYLFAGPEHQRRFLEDPDRFAPVLSGNDVVLAVEQGQAVTGRREHGVDFGGRIYLFSSEATLEQFSKNPQIYAARILQAMRTEDGQRQPIR